MEGTKGGDGRERKREGGRGGKQEKLRCWMLRKTGKESYLGSSFFFFLVFVSHNNTENDKGTKIIFIIRIIMKVLIMMVVYTG